LHSQRDRTGQKAAVITQKIAIVDLPQHSPTVTTVVGNLIAQRFNGWQIAQGALRHSGPDHHILGR
jgi:hypothetical protein